MLSAKPVRSERDTQALLVEPVLTDLAGWCAEDIYRAEVSDIIVREEGHQASGLLKPPRLVIEVKTFKPRDWLSWKYIRNGGAIKSPVSAKARTFDLIRKNDSIGQLRVICCKLFLKKDYKPGYTIPVLTNGYWWLLFNSRSFVASNKLSQPIGAVADSTLDKSDFCSKILSRISRTPTKGG